MGAERFGSGIRTVMPIALSPVVGGAWAGRRWQGGKNQNQRTARTQTSKWPEQARTDLGSVSARAGTDDFLARTNRFPEGWSVDAAVMGRENPSATRFLPFPVDPSQAESLAWPSGFEAADRLKD